MYQLFAQTDFSELDTTTVDPYSSGSYSTTNNPEFGAGMIALIVVGVVLAIITIAGLWKVFQKAGRPGWAAIVPVYNNWVFFEIAGKPGWWGLIAFLGVIPIIGIIPSLIGLVLAIIACIELSKRFGRGAGTTLLQIFLPFVAYPMLGFGSAKYTATGPAAAAGQTPAGPATPAGSVGSPTGGTAAPTSPANESGATPGPKPPQPPSNTLVQ